MLVIKKNDVSLEKMARHTHKVNVNLSSSLVTKT